MKNLAKVTTALACFLILSACGDPMNYFEKELKKYGYIRYRTPMQDAGTGTLVGGTPKDLAFVTSAQTCFPDTIPSSGSTGIATNLRYIDDTTLPKRSEKVYFSQETFVRLFEILEAGNMSIKAGLSLDHVHGIELEMQGVHVEYMDSVKLSEFYRSEYMKPICKEYLNSIAFIIQALKVDNMKFTFFDQNGGHLEVTVENIENFLDIGTDVKWRVERQTSLIIDSPKYIGYQLGALREKDNAMVLYRATSEKRNKFNFKPLYVFDLLDKEESKQQKAGILDLPDEEFVLDLDEIERNELSINVNN